MNIVLWIIQILLALMFLFAGVPKVVLPIDLLLQMGSPNQVRFPELFIRFIGVCETLGAFGLILPGVFRRQRYLTPLAAAGLVIIMIGAVVVATIADGAKAGIIPLIAGLLCAFVVYGRWNWRQD